jgi:hypothetical protein
MAGKPLSPPEFFDRFYHTYGVAERSAGSCPEYDYIIGGYRIRLRFAGPRLVSAFTQAIAHLSVARSPDPPDLTVCLWDSQSTGVTLPPCPWQPQDMQLRGEVTHYTTSELLTVLQLDTGAVSMLDYTKNLGVYWIAAERHVFAYERAAPLKIILHAWLAKRGLPMIHAGAVGSAAGAVLITGKTGSGKSTASLACLSNGLNYLSDDRCLVSLQNGKTMAYCVYNSAKLHADHISRFPHLLPYITNSQETVPEKSLVFVQQFAPQRILSPLPIKAILLAKVAHQPDTTLSPIGAMAVLRELASSTLVYQPGAAHDEVHAMAELVRRVPCYRINLGYNLESIPPVVAGLIEQAGEPV